MQTNRVQKVAVTIQRALSEILLRTSKDPDLNLVTILKVTITRDLKYAKAYFSVLGDKERQKKAIAAINRARSFLRTEVGKQLNLRFVPELSFFYDDSIEYAIHIDQLIEKINKDG